MTVRAVSYLLLFFNAKLLSKTQLVYVQREHVLLVRR